METGSLIYVPLAGGLVRPYERRRAGDLAGTEGSTAPTYPVSLSAGPESIAPGLVQTPADARPVGAMGAAHGVEAGASEPLRQPIATGGSTGLLVSELPRGRPPRRETVRRESPNAAFVQFGGGRWFAAGRAIEFDPARLSRIGEHHGFDVFTEPGRPGTIYVPSIGGAPGLVAPYARR
jgi:hypothetical protein